MSLPELTADGQLIKWIRIRPISRQDGIIEALVLGQSTWYEDSRFCSLLFNVREAKGEFFANEDGAVWVSADSCVDFPNLSFADTEAMAANRQIIPDLNYYLKAKARQFLVEKINPFGLGKALTPNLENAITEALDCQNLSEISIPDLESLVPSLQQVKLGDAA